MSVNSKNESDSSPVAEDTPSASSSYNVFRSNTLPNAPSTSDDSSTSTSSSKTLVSSPSKRSTMRYGKACVQVDSGIAQANYSIGLATRKQFMSSWVRRSRISVCQRSKFFQAAFNGSFAEASKGMIELLEEDSAIFRHCAHMALRRPVDRASEWG